MIQLTEQIELQYTPNLTHLYNAYLSGIRGIFQEESYTRKCSFLDNESMEPQTQYQGKRIHCGLFRTVQGYFNQVDVNRGYNIVRKVFPKAFPNVDGIVDGGLHPKPLRIVI
jgi:putative transposase